MVCVFIGTQGYLRYLKIHTKLSYLLVALTHYVLNEYIRNDTHKTVYYIYTFISMFKY